MGMYVLWRDAMVYHTFDELIGAIQQNRRVRTVAVVAAADEHTLEAVCRAQKNKIVIPILIGDQNKIIAELTKMGERSADIKIIDIPDEQEAAFEAVRQVRSGNADFIMKGRIQTANLLHAVVDKKYGLCTGQMMSLLMLHELPGYHKLLTITDGGMVMYPSLEEKKTIIQNAVDVYHSMGIKEPKVAVLASVEGVNPKMPETIDADALKKMNLDGDLCGCIVEGPIPYDLAMSREAASIKGYRSQVVGDVDIMLVPNITVGNILSKALVVSAGGKMAGFVVGALAPIVITSRGSSSEEKYLSLVLSALAAKNKDKEL
jgi:phosphate butyryltransferase